MLIASTPEEFPNPGLPEMAQLCRNEAKAMVFALARERAERCLAQGKWLAISDASVDSQGRAAIAWGVFSPDGALAAFGSQQIALKDERSNTLAEALGVIAAARALADLKAPAAVCMADCRSAIAWISGRDPAREDLRKAWEASSDGRFEIQWAPRDAMGPANDASRAALGLAPEKAKIRRWERYLNEMGIAHDSTTKPAPQERSARFARAVSERSWIALADAELSSDEKSAGISISLFNPSGALTRQTSTRLALRTGAGLAEAQAKAAEWAAKEAGRAGARNVCCFTSSQSVADRFSRRIFGDKIQDVFVFHLPPELGVARFEIAWDPRLDMRLSKHAAKRAAVRNPSDHVGKCKDLSNSEPLFHSWMQERRHALRSALIEAAPQERKAVL